MSSCALTTGKLITSQARKSFSRPRSSECAKNTDRSIMSKHHKSYLSEGRNGKFNNKEKGVTTSFPD